MLSWLSAHAGWDAALSHLKHLRGKEFTASLRELAGSQMDFAQANRLDRAFTRALKADGVLEGLQPLRLAIIASSTTSHLPAGIRLAGLRLGIAVDVYEAAYGMYLQELMESGSRLHSFRPQVLLVALDAHHLAASEGATPEAALNLMRCCWQKGKQSFSCHVIQQAVMPVFPRLLGNNEARMPHSPASVVQRVNELLRPLCNEESVDLLALDEFAAVEGINCWYDLPMWHRSKHEVHPRMTQLYGDQVMRIVGAARGLAAKCLVLDLDNTLCGGVIGEDGLDGIVLGQGGGQGEAFTEFQHYAKRLAQRGVVLAVCSKNEEANALEPFEKHPEMVLRRGDIACFIANWADKASNLRRIAHTLNLGLDSLVFVDDNPAERALIRKELPMVRVPELPQDPARYAAMIAAAGYFEGVRVTADDQRRTRLYQENTDRARLMESAVDMESYLGTLQMRMQVKPFDTVGVARITQLINKTNQFNLTTERLSEAEVVQRMLDPQVITMQVRLADRFGDNGVIAILIARVRGSDAEIEIWLMSCRVLGRRVEDACLNVLVEHCARRGVRRLIGLYRASAKNDIVRNMYGTLGFGKQEDGGDSNIRWVLDLGKFMPAHLPIEVDTEAVTSY